MRVESGVNGTMQRVAVVAIMVLAVFAGVATAQQSRVFISSSVFPSGDLGGLAGADMTCNNLAAAAGLGGNWVAWLSTSTENAVDRLIPGSGPFVRAQPPMAGLVIANDIIELTSGTLQNSIQLDELGFDPGSNGAVWTGTRPDGTVATDPTFHCSGTQGVCACDAWTSASGDGGTWGNSAFADSRWTAENQGEPIGCQDDEERIYCFELPAPVAPTLPPIALALFAAMLLAGGAYLYRRRQAVG